MRLAVAAMLISILIGVGGGVVAAWKWKTPLDYLTMGGTVVGVSMPVFWLGVLLIYLFSMRLGWLPASGFGMSDNVPAVLLVDPNFGVLIGGPTWNGTPASLPIPIPVLPILDGLTVFVQGAIVGYKPDLVTLKNTLSAGVRLHIGCY